MKSSGPRERRPLVVLSIVGTRPEAIKMAPVIAEAHRHPTAIRSVVCATGQHRQMLDQALALFDLTPDIDLGVMQPNQSLPQLTASLIHALDGVMAAVRPDWVLAQGDTTSVLAASLVAFYHRVRFGHVEAGLRTGNLSQPFPEEMNRRLADTLAHLHFAPTARARRALLDEGVAARSIHVTGNTVVDALREIGARPFDWAGSPLAHLATRRLVLVTAHRRESFGEPFRELCWAIHDLATRFADAGVHFIYPVHLNPNVRAPVFEILAGLRNVSLIEPVDYLTLIQIMKRAELILTDSGGIQEEAPTFGVPVLVMRDTTERPEGVEAGVAQLVGTSRARIVTTADQWLRQPRIEPIAPAANPYGDGGAAARIIAALLESSPL